MDLDGLKLLLEVARRGSFAAVARDRGTEPSTVSRAVAEVERALGFRVFHRTTRRLSPTEAGTLFLERATGSIETLEAAAEEGRAVTAEPAGELRLTASVAFGVKWLLPRLAAFRAAYPRVTLDLIITDERVDMVRDRVDLAIRLAPSIDADVVCTRLMPMRYRVCASPGYLARHGSLDGPQALATRDCVLFSLPEFRSRWLFRRHDGAGGILSVPISGSVVISNALSVYEAAKLGLGPALLVDWVAAPDLAAGRLVDLLPDYEASASNFDTAAWLLYPSRSYLPQKVRVMIDFLRQPAAAA